MSLDTNIRNEQQEVEAAENLRQLIGDAGSRSNPDKVIDYWNGLTQTQKDYIAGERRYKYCLNAIWFRRYLGKLKGLDLKKLKK